MKKLLIAFSVFVAINMNAQVLGEGDSMLNLGLGLGAYGGGTGYTTKVPPLYASYEYMINDNISVGGYVGYHQMGYSLNTTLATASWNYSYLHFAGQAAYHFLNDDQLDVYGGLRLGYTNVTNEYDVKVKNEYEGAYSIPNEQTDASGSGILFGFQVGGRYFFSDSFAVNLELGYGIAILQAGVTLKF